MQGYFSAAEWYEKTTGMSGECLTPEWNVNYYQQLLQYTKHTVKRNKVLRELKWWIEMQECEKKAKQIKAS